MQKWEYMTIREVCNTFGIVVLRSNDDSVLGGNMSVVLNKLGEQGWEVAGCWGPASDDVTVVIILKRPMA